MKAFLLAAGRGSRLGAITSHTPKCLLKIQDKPILQYWLEALARCGVTEVLVNTHYLYQQVREYLNAWNGIPRVIEKFEPELLGSAGTLFSNQDFVDGEECFFVCYADNWTHFDLIKLVRPFEKMKSKNPWGVIALHRTQEPERCGIASLNTLGWVESFIEKPKNPASNLANSGIYLFTPEAIKKLPRHFPLDIAYDLIPNLIPGLLGVEMDEFLIDIGTPESYQKACDHSLKVKL